ncbi:hypothetical protein DPEC_G00054940 [Dallia pectoralis]|uniref:Uncharacterized protein n=1 Tax=Dallia pectoralis TaxID=75939 RepID=A0ACC2H5Z5_DALPE|nr:hypothetical protein DPEC_G00054940 [Dallia pectoralis]
MVMFGLCPQTQLTKLSSVDMKMTGFVSVLLVISVTLLFTAKGQSHYNMLNVVERKYVDMAIKSASEKTWPSPMPKNEHFNFQKILGLYVIKPQYVQINLLLKATDCPKASSSSGHKHRSECAFKPRRPYINCVVCSNDFKSADVYIGCVRQKDVKPGNDERLVHCKSHFYGGVSFTECGLVGPALNAVLTPPSRQWQHLCQINSSLPVDTIYLQVALGKVSCGKAAEILI